MAKQKFLEKIYVKLQQSHKKCSKRLVANAKSCNKWKNKKSKSAGKTSWKREKESWKSCKWRKWKVAGGKWRVQSLRKYNCANWKSMCQWVKVAKRFRHNFATSLPFVSCQFIFLERAQKSMHRLIGLKCQTAAGTNAHNFNQNNCPLAAKLHQLPLSPFTSLCLSLLCCLLYVWLIL